MCLGPCVHSTQCPRYQPGFAFRSNCALDDCPSVKFSKGLQMVSFPIVPSDSKLVTDVHSPKFYFTKYQASQVLVILLGVFQLILVGDGGTSLMTCFWTNSKSQELAAITCFMEFAEGMKLETAEGIRSFNWPKTALYSGEYFMPGLHMQFPQHFQLKENLHPDQCTSRPMYQLVTLTLTIKP
uniref:Uncharacterized protein n=1 Tax=Rhizophora mucronata TaxID=61149 RepID=A0A2P2J4B0_RHIMU